MHQRTLWPALALVSINMTFNSLARRSPSSVVTSLTLGLSLKPCFACIDMCDTITTYRFSFKSVLLPTSTTITWSPRSARTSSIHRVVFTNDSRSTRNRDNESYDITKVHCQMSTYLRYRKQSLPQMSPWIIMILSMLARSKSCL